jgi:DNA-3-methyladenine glycosylase I
MSFSVRTRTQRKEGEEKEESQEKTKKRGRSQGEGKEPQQSILPQQKTTSKRHRCEAERPCFGHDDESLRRYHDCHWGKPSTDRRELFASLCLQMFQCGLSWSTVWRKRDAFLAAFDSFDYHKIARYTDAHVEALVANAGIIRNRKKIQAVIQNARVCVAIDERDGGGGGGIERYFWSFVRNIPESERIIPSGKFPKEGHMRTDYKTKAEDRTEADGVHATAVCAAMASAMRRDGFQFCGPVAVLCFLQASGLVNHHRASCALFQTRDDEWRHTVESLFGSDQKQ